MKEVNHSIRKAGMAFLILIIPFFSSAKNTIEKPGLQLSFHVYDGSVVLRNYSLEICRNGEMTDSISVRKLSTFYITLDLNSSYVIRINRPGFRERLILVETKVPERKKNKLFEYSFDISMVVDSMGANTLADLPAMLIQYNAREKDFDYSQTYSKSVGHLPDLKKDRRLKLHGMRRKRYSA